MAVARFLVAFVLASGVTFGLFYLMQSLIGVEGELDKSDKVKVVDFVRVKRSEETKQKERKVPEKKEIDDEPPPPDMNFETDSNMDTGGISIGGAVDAKLNIADSGGFSMASADGDAVPMVRVQPQYPEKARQRGIEGKVLVQFTITKVGTVKDGKVVAAEPSSIFNRAALKAIAQWKYSPKVENGKAVEQRGIKQVLVFQLDKSSS